MSRPRWRASDMTDQSGKLAIVTGGNSGVGAVVSASSRCTGRRL